MRRLTSALTLVALGAIAGCGDHGSPTAAAPPPALDVAASSGTQYSFDLSPKGGVYWLGEFFLVVPANAVCDPATSSYGPGTWQDPCTPATTAVHVDATVSTVGGRDYLDFSQHLRFVPAKNPSGWVTLHTVRLAAIGGKGDLRRFSILFAAAPGGTEVDESAADSSLATHVNPGTGALWRRIEHFTGYNVHTGLVDDCTPGVDDGCYAIGTIIPDATQ
jgi:hypothetical protein